MRTLLSALFIAFAIFFTSCDEDNPVKQGEHIEAAGIILYNGSEIFMRIFEAQFDQAYNTSFELKAGETTDEFEIVFLDEDGHEIELEHHDHTMIEVEEEEHSFGFLISDESILELIPDPEDEWGFSLMGKVTGSTDIELRLMHGDHPDFKTPKIPVVVE